MGRSKFKELVDASDAGEAFGQVGPKYGKTSFSVVYDTVNDARKAIIAKLKRVEENPGLYSDRIEQYNRWLNDIDRELPELGEAETLVNAMLSHGDSRVDNLSRCAVIQDGNKWFVFGFHFS